MGADNEQPADEAGKNGHASMVGAMLRASFMDMYEQEQPQVLDELLARLATNTDGRDAAINPCARDVAGETKG